MSSKQLWSIIAGLVLLNVITILLFTTGPFSSLQTFGEKDKKETVAKIGDSSITRQEWIAELENRYGKEVLKEMVDEKVVLETAKKYNIKVTDEELERELTFIKTMYGSFDQQQLQNEDKWKQQIKTSILLEKLVTKDVNISEKEMKEYYENHKDSFKIPETYHLSHIVVEKKSQAEQIYNELKDGTPFSVLAMEKSTDNFTSSQGGNLGFITSESSRVPKKYIEVASELKKKHFSKPIKIENGYAVLFLHDKIKQKEYSFKEVKSQIQRQMALEQMQEPPSASYFWEEQQVEWYYEED
ncbi:peptidyl-prolyl cis-trans isomerase [Peribacillus tepidiphilus]|uniref:peptidyl-prolyl cis-trans isomerase n=1 Tax=Peribacillus tepidiphilus TaxID=2652445 RepID=UPI0035B55926